MWIIRAPSMVMVSLQSSCRCSLTCSWRKSPLLDSFPAMRTLVSIFLTHALMGRELQGEGRVHRAISQSPFREVICNQNSYLERRGSRLSPVSLLSSHLFLSGVNQWSHIAGPHSFRNEGGGRPFSPGWRKHVVKNDCTCKSFPSKF